MTGRRGDFGESFVDLRSKLLDVLQQSILLNDELGVLRLELADLLVLGVLDRLLLACLGVDLG